MRFFIVSFAATLIALGGLAFAPATAQAQTAPDDDVGLITSWYQRYLGRNPDPQGLQGWLEELDRGRDVEAAILGSDEYFQRHGSTDAGFVTGLYLDVLTRQPRSDEVQSWLARLQQVGYDREAMASDFLAAAQTELRMRRTLPPPHQIPRSATVAAHGSPHFDGWHWR